jgi:peptidoglycan/LPS O-acetylase OafA/YrhL
VTGGHAQTQAQPAVAPPPGNPRFPLFDGLRGIAALSVLGIHTIVFTDYFPGWQGAYARQLAGGVCVFFVISGFLLYRPFVAARLSGKSPIRLRDYARRRLLRIVPAYWFALSVLMLWPGLPGDVSGDWWIYFGFLQDYQDATLFGGLGTAWSLGTEVTFYALLPFYAFVLARPRLQRSATTVLVTELSVLALLSIASLGFRAALTGSSHKNLNYTLAGTFDWFALGMGLAVVSAVIAHTGVRPRAVAFVERHASLSWAASFGVLTIAAWYWQHTRDYDAYTGGPLHLMWGAMAFFLVLPAAFAGGSSAVPHRILGNRTVAWLGLISYGIYLWHLPLVAKVGEGLERIGIEPSGLLLTLTLIGLVAAVTVSCAAFSYYVVERPLLKLKERRTQGPPEPLPPAVIAAESPAA